MHIKQRNLEHTVSRLLILTYILIMLYVLTKSLNQILNVEVASFLLNPGLDNLSCTRDLNSSIMGYKSVICTIFKSRIIRKGFVFPSKKHSSKACITTRIFNIFDIVIIVNLSKTVAFLLHSTAFFFNSYRYNQLHSYTSFNLPPH